MVSGIKECSAAMTQGIGEVVTAMQFHDISRQQLENAAKAVLESREKIASSKDGILSDDNEQDALEVYGILNIQTAHLNSIYEQILTARRQIETGLKTTLEQSTMQPVDAGATDSIGLLQNIMEQTEKQVQFSSDLNQNREVIDTMIEKAKTLTGTILSSMQDVSALAQKMGRDSQDLSFRINKLIPGIQFPLIMGDRIEGNWKLLGDIIEKIEERYPQFTEKNSEVERMMEKLSEKYVMDRERSIHAQVAGGGSAQEDSESDDFELFEDDGFESFDDDSGQETDAQGKKEKEFGDNVELF